MLLIVDAMIDLLIVVVSLDYLRANHFSQSPIHSIAFFAMAVAAFGLLMERLAGIQPSASSVLLHAALVAYAASHRSSIADSWHLAGVDRRAR